MTYPELMAAARIMSRNMMLSLRRRNGVRAHIARELGLTWQDVDRWYRVPVQHVFQVACVMKIPADHIRPDFFLDDPKRQTAAYIEANRAVPFEEPKRKPLNGKHRRIWRSRKYRTDGEAAKAVGDLLGRYIQPRTLGIHFGSSGRPSGSGRGGRRVRGVAARPDSKQNRMTVNSRSGDADTRLGAV